MPRPFKCRRIHFAPDFSVFKPAGVPGRELAEIGLSLDECEALRLADLQGLYQEECAQRMGISRQTFGNIIDEARRKIADVIINGKLLMIGGGHYDLLGKRNFVCHDCAHEWSVPFGTGRPRVCPDCRSVNLHRPENGRRREGVRNRGQACRRRRCGRTRSKLKPQKEALR